MSLSQKSHQPESNGNPVQQLFHSTYALTNKCVQCGYCLPVCPTYDSMGKESASPRGRINLVRLASEGKIDIQENLKNPIDLCLGCRACEVACPVNVPYGHILEFAKQAIEESQKEKERAVFGERMKRLSLMKLFPYPERLRAIGNLVWLYQKSGVAKFVRKTKVIHRISEPFANLENVLPSLESPGKRYKWGTVISAKGQKKSRVAFFAGCVMDALMYRTNRLTIELLTSVGCEVVMPQNQTCCGALHAHQGLLEQAKALAKANIEAFEKSEADFYVNNAGGCGAILREYDHLLMEDQHWKERAARFVNRSRDISEILMQYGPLSYRKERRGVLIYQDSCHLRYVQGVYDEPRHLLRSIPGADVVEWEDSGSCCGSGGIYNMLNYEESIKILDKKMEKVKAMGATTIVTANPGCLLQMRLGAERLGLSNHMQAVHIVDVLAEACGFE
ncbi:(Fe-S)-binding protein [Lihuaxuella thermophila]|uniref:Glycolate oxidase iron-sulfur subunit n=1 Tax=Lihuaxuella thermophila TaxID=1173111 RepID=A0A1H8J8B2_9BACL|nr:(Fe-S)-binding protein [Lihuaxuella thermophila]SEN76919.1 glycolate oxidase iron-sulfur subunit [Lihuaxuella thermophila]